LSRYFRDILAEVVAQGFPELSNRKIDLYWDNLLQEECLLSVTESKDEIKIVLDYI